MNIQPTYATFEQAKLLKEKEWRQRTKMVWLDSLGNQHLREVDLSLELNNAEYDAPEQWQIVEWLRVEKGIWIYILPYSTLFRPYAEELIDKNKFGKWEGHIYSSPQEAYSTAFDYVLNHLL